jgi:hypothetical protein
MARKPEPSKAAKLRVEAEETAKNWFALVSAILFIFERQVECHEPPTWHELKSELGKRAYLMVGRVASNRHDDSALVWGERVRTPRHRRLTVQLTFRGRQFARDLMVCQPFTAPIINERQAILSLVRANRD